MSELEETIGTLKRINPKVVREMSIDEMENLHMELMPDHNNLIVDLQESVVNLKQEVHNNEKTLTNDMTEINNDLDSIKKLIEENNKTISKLNDSDDKFCKTCVIVRIIVVILIIMCFAQWYFVYNINREVIEMEKTIRNYAIEYHINVNKSDK